MTLNVTANTALKHPSISYQKLKGAVQRGDIKTLKGMMQEGADITETDDIGNTLLFQAVQGQHVEAVRILIESGYIDVNHQNSGGYTALMWAVDRNNETIVKLLVENGADVNICMDDYGWNALFRAVQADKKGMVQLMVDHGADIEMRKKGEENAIDMANRLNNTAMADLLTDALESRRRKAEEKVKEEKAKLKKASDDAFSKKMQNLKKHVKPLKIKPGPQP